MTDHTDHPAGAEPRDESAPDAVLGLPEPGPSYSLQQFPEKLAVVKLPPGSEIPSWAESSSLFSITATATETSVVCAGRDVPTKVIAQRGLTGFAVQGEITHEAIGMTYALLGPLADAGISVFTIATFGTNWFLVPVSQADRAAEAWQAAGHVVEIAIPVKPAKKGRKK